MALFIFWNSFILIVFRIEEEMTIIQDNLKQIKLGRKHKITYIKDLKSHPEVYKPFLIIMVYLNSLSCVLISYKINK
jgi:hypothetical protein